jgi:hypothetical protein
MPSDPAVLPDGTYDAFIIDATEDAGTDADDRDALRVDLTIIAGAHKGEVVTVTATYLASAADPMDLLGMPATLTVAGGEPTVSVDR